MNAMENIYICLAAPLLLAILCLRREGRRTLIFLLTGMTVCLLSAYVSAFAADLMMRDYAFAAYEITPAVEESLKFLPVLFYLLVFAPERDHAVSGTLLVSVGFATFENVCFLTSYGTDQLLRVAVRGFGTGAMHVVCGTAVAVELFLLWDRNWLRLAGTMGVLCFVITFHAVFNICVDQTGAVFAAAAAIPLILLLLYLFFIHPWIKNRE